MHDESNESHVLSNCMVSRDATAEHQMPSCPFESYPKQDWDEQYGEDGCAFYDYLQGPGHSFPCDRDRSRQEG